MAHLLQTLSGLTTIRAFRYWLINIFGCTGVLNETNCASTFIARISAQVAMPFLP
jgi:hypothetical protein